MGRRVVQSVGPVTAEMVVVGARGCNWKRPELPVTSDRSWPSMTTERSTTNGRHAFHNGRCKLGQLLYDPLRPVVAGGRPAVDDP